MKKTLATKLAIGAIAGATMFGGVGKADADIAPEITTTIYDDQDYDLSREGVQVKYEWAVKNKSPPAVHWTEDAINKYTILGDLENRGMYNFDVDNDPSGWNWNGGSESNNYTLGTGSLVRPAFGHKFTALVNANDIIGNELVQSYATAHDGAVSPMADITVPMIPEPATVGLVAGTGALLLGIRRFFRI